MYSTCSILGRDTRVLLSGSKILLLAVGYGFVLQSEVGLNTYRSIDPQFSWFEYSYYSLFFIHSQKGEKQQDKIYGFLLVKGRVSRDLLV